MLYKVKLKNADDSVLLDDKVYDYLTNDPYLKKVDFINNLRKHSSGCAVFQKTWKKADGGYKTETIYLHKLVAEKYLSETKSGKRNLVGAKNGNKLDCRLENLIYRSRSVASRKRKTSSKIGYTGVYKENNRYRAVISVDRKSVHIGMFATAEAAALAYNKKSRELYGDEGKVNLIKVQKEEGKEELA
ncbi:MAG: Pathogenesis-related transcriptional factor and ERF protein [Bacteroidota bacterium]